MKVPLKHLAFLNPESLSEDTAPDRQFRYIDIASTGRGVLLEQPQRMTFEASPSRARRVLRPGDTILSTVRTYLRAVWTMRGADDDLVASTGFLCLRPRPCVDPRFLGWLTQADSVVEEVVANSVGVSYPAINPSDVGRIKVPCPPLTDQHAIANYLDRETARIDALTAAKLRMVDVLEERLRATVSDATRAGLALDVRSTLPDQWTRRPLRRCLAAIDYGISDRTGVEGEYAVLGMSNVNAGTIGGPPGGFVPGVDQRLLLSPGDLLFNRTNSRELVGKVGLVRTLDRPTTFASYLVRLKANDRALPGYLNYLLNSPEILGLARSMALPSIGQANLNPTRYSAITVPLPPLAEQRSIVCTLDALALRTQRMTEALARQVSLLVERRRSVVSSAVDGQLGIPVPA